MGDPRASIILMLRDLASTGLTKIGSKLDKIAKDAERAKFIFGALAGGVALIGKAALTTAGRFEQWRIAFTTMLGSADKADFLLKKIRDFAAKTPFDLPQVVEGSKRLLAFGIAAKDIIPTMKALGDVASGVGVPMDRIVNVFGQVRAAGRLMGQEVLQFTNAGIPILELLAKKFDTNASAIKKMVEQGKIGFEDVRAVLFAASAEGGKFADLMTKQNESLLGMLSELSDAFTEIKLAIGDALLPIAKDFVKSAIGAAQGIRDWVEANRALTIISLTLVGAFAGMLTVVGGLLAIWGPLTAAFSVTLAILGAMLSPVGLLIAAIAILTTNFAGLGDVAQKTIEGIMDSFSELGRGFQALARGDFSGAMQIFKNAALNATSEVLSGFGNAADNLKTKWSEVKDFFDKNKVVAKAGITLGGDEDFGAEVEDPKIAKLLAQADKEIEIARLTAEQRKAIRTESLADELDFMGQFEKANELREAAASKNRLKAAKSTLGALVSLQSSSNKEMAAVGKAAAIAQATIDTFAGASAAAKALAGIPFIGPALAVAAAAAFIASGTARVAQISGVALATGAVVLPTPGGTKTTIGEAGGREAVLPLDDDAAIAPIVEALGGGGVNLQVGVLVADDAGIEELARMIDEKLFHFDRTQQRASA